MLGAEPGRDLRLCRKLCFRPFLMPYLILYLLLCHMQCLGSALAVSRLCLILWRDLVLRGLGIMLCAMVSFLRWVTLL